MKYIGTLYGKVAGKYFPLMQTSEDFDRLELSETSLRSEITRSRETIEIVAAQRNRALEAVEKLRETIIDTARFLKAHQDKTDGELYTIGKLEEVLAATEPATVELPKCDHCGAIACGTDCDGSSHYTPEKKE